MNGGILTTGVEFVEPDLIDPDGQTVVWAEEVLPDYPGIVRVMPQSGWIAGDYRYGWQPEVVAYTIVDEFDDTAPQVVVNGWVGQSERHAPGICGASQSAGVALDLEVDEASALHAWWRGSQAVGEPNGYVWHDFIGANQGEQFEITLHTFDLAGNSRETYVGEVTACGGCQGSVAGSTFGPLWALVLLGVIRVRRTVIDE